MGIQGLKAPVGVPGGGFVFCPLPRGPRHIRPGLIPTTRHPLFEPAHRRATARLATKPLTAHPQATNPAGGPTRCIQTRPVRVTSRESSGPPTTVRNRNHRVDAIKSSKVCFAVGEGLPRWKKDQPAP